MHNPVRMLGTFIRPGMIVIDYGSAMGYFSIPLAKMVGNQGTVFCFDIQRKMLEKLIIRARKASEKFVTLRSETATPYYLKNISNSLETNNVLTK